MSRRIHSPNPIIVAPKICRETKKEKTGGQRKREERKKEERINHIVQDRRGTRGPTFQFTSCNLFTPNLLDRAKDGNSSINVFPERQEGCVLVCESM